MPTDFFFAMFGSTASALRLKENLAPRIYTDSRPVKPLIENQRLKQPSRAFDFAGRRPWSNKNGTGTVLSIPPESIPLEYAGMRRRAVPIILLCFIFISLPSSARTHNQSSRKIDSSYSSALAAANRFLNAWQTEDHETGIVMLTDSAREHASAEKLQSFFSPGPQAAYEIAHGYRLRAGVYVFPVVLFAAAAASVDRHACTVIIRRLGKTDWGIDKLP
jgi:hypothetical protein